MSTDLIWAVPIVSCEYVWLADGAALTFQLVMLLIGAGGIVHLDGHVDCELCE